MLILGLASALGAPPLVVHGGAPRAAMRQARRDVGFREAEVVSAAALAPSGPLTFVRAAVVEPCEGPASDNQGLLRLLAEAEELRVAMRPEGFAERLGAAEQAWACLGEPADAALGARLQYLVGIQQAARGHDEAATEAFVRALQSDPGLQWDPDFAPDARGLFDAAKAVERVQIPIRVVPAGATPALRVDGRSVELRDGRFVVPAGRHLFQTGSGASVWADVTEADWLIVGAAREGAWVVSVDAASTREATTGLLLHGAPDRRVLVPGASSTWAWTAEADAAGRWSEHRASAARRLRAPVSAAGAVLLLGGAAWMLAESASGAGRIDRVSGTLDDPGLADLQAAHEAGRRRWAIAAGITAAGAVTATVGGAMVVASW